MRKSWGLTVGLFLYLLVAGCGNAPLSTPTTNSITSESPPGSQATNVVGFLGRDGVSSRPPVAPRAQVVVVARDPSGKVLTRTTTGADGSFLLRDCAPGLLVLEFYATGRTSPEFTLPVTAVHGASVTVGGGYPVSREAAIGRLNLPTDARVFGSMNPLPGGITLADEVGVKLTVLNPSWLFFVDPLPDVYMEHPVQYLVVDAQTGEVSTLDALSWPYINGWRSWLDRYLEEGNRPADVVQVGGLATAAPKAEAIPIRPRAAQPVLNKNTFAVLMRGYGDNEQGITAARGYFKDWLLEQGVSQDHIEEVDLGGLSKAQADQAFFDGVHKFKSPLRELARQGTPSTLIILICSHGVRRFEAEIAGFRGYFSTSGNDPNANLPTLRYAHYIQALDDYPIKAFRICLVSDHCFAGLLSQELADHLLPTREWEFWSSCADEECADESFIIWPDRIKSLWFTHQLTLRATLSQGHILGLTVVKDLQEEFVSGMRAYSVVQQNKLQTQRPQILRKTLDYPVLDSFSPVRGEVGDTVTLKAHSLAHGFQVYFAPDVRAELGNFEPDNLGGNVTIQVKVPAGATSGAIQISNLDGKESSNVTPFQVGNSGPPSAYPKAVSMRLNTTQPYETGFSGTVDRDGHALSLRLIAEDPHASDRGRYAGVVDNSGTFVLVDSTRSYPSLPADRGTSTGPVTLMFRGGLQNPTPTDLYALISHIRLNDGATGTDELDSRNYHAVGEGPDPILHSGGQALLPTGRVAGDFEDPVQGVAAGTLEVAGSAVTLRVTSMNIQLAGTIGSDGRCEFTNWLDPGSLYLGNMASGGAITGIIRSRIQSPATDFRFTPRPDLIPLPPDSLLH